MMRTIIIVGMATLLFSSLSVRASTVSGVVLESGSQAPIPDARVTLFEPTLQFFQEVRTDAQGQFLFTNVPLIDILQLGASSRGREYVEVEAIIKGDSFEYSFVLGPETHPGEWNIVGNTLPEFFDATDIGILRTDGKIFFCHDTVDPIVFDPATGQKTFPMGSWSSQGCMNASLRADGSILMIGGQDGSDPGSFTDAIPWVKGYDSLVDSWFDPPDLQHPSGRWYPGLARLADGSLLVMGGGTAPSAVRTETCERLDLATQQWSYTGSMENPTEFPPSALLFTGDVLATWWPPQLYSPATGQWRLTQNFVQPNRSWPGHSDHSIIVLKDGRVLAIGVISGPDSNTVMGETYDVATETWSLTSNPELVRFQTEVVQLPDGRVLVAGGETEFASPPVPQVLGIVKWCDLYDVATNTWRRVADMNWHREYHAVTLLVPDGRVLTTGGTRIKFQVGPTTADIEAYSPPYLFRGVRPEIVSVSKTDLARGSFLTVELAFESSITSLELVGMQTTTHWVDGGIPRHICLPVQQNGTTITTELPANPNIAMLGHYMLFAMVDDIPSVGRIVKIVESEGDFDADGDVDIGDFAQFALCSGGPDVPPAVTCPAGVDADFDNDDDVDLGDFASFSQGFTGAL